MPHARTTQIIQAVRNYFLVSLVLALAMFVGCKTGGREFVQRKLLYFPTRQLEADPSTVFAKWEQARLTAEDGTKVHAWFIPHEGSSQAVLVCHGNAGNISHRLELAEIFHDLGFNVLLFDYRGYGQSEGTPTETGTYQDAMSAMAWLEKRGFQSDQTVLYGESLGGAVAAEVASRKKVRALILQSSFTSLEGIASELYPFLPVRWLCTFKYDTLSKLPRVETATLIIHSRSDTIVPFHHAERLFKAAKDPKILKVLNGGHNGILFEDEANFRAAIREFLQPLDPAKDKTLP